jgi:hypothetical protein
MKVQNMSTLFKMSSSPPIGSALKSCQTSKALSARANTASGGNLNPLWLNFLLDLKPTKQSIGGEQRKVRKSPIW